MLPFERQTQDALPEVGTGRPSTSPHVIAVISTRLATAKPKQPLSLLMWAEREGRGHLVGPLEASWVRSKQRYGRKNHIFISLRCPT